METRSAGDLSCQIRLGGQTLEQLVDEAETASGDSLDLAIGGKLEITVCL